ncbi:hypothetical protein V5O48_001314 [Marasmius crinis-equi]|uniref:Methyltransferase domain-containing protein n=1 Tax=Marasmius crinis-equi TaxID=585013 RepID=A0ABR3FYZ1_9AGAR
MFMGMDNVTVDDATSSGYNPYDQYSAPLLPTPPNSADPYSPIFLLSPPPSTSYKRKSHYKTFSQAQLLTPPDSAGLPPEQNETESKALRPTKLSRPRSFLHIPRSHSKPRPVSSMGFISSKKDKEKVKEEKKEEKKEKKSKEKGKGKEKEKKSEEVSHVEEWADGTVSRAKFSFHRPSSSSSSSSMKPAKDKTLKKKRSVARLLMLASSEPPPTVILPPEPNNRLRITPVSTAALVSSSYEEKPGPLLVPVVLNDEEGGDEEGRYTYAVEHRDSIFSTKFRMKNRWSIQHGMRMHPHGSDAIYMQSYEHMSMEKLNSNGTPSFHDYSKLGESPPSCVLDMACGQGFWLLQAATQWPNSKIVGLDIVDVTLPRVKSRDNIEFIGGNFLHYALPFPSNSFDYVRIANASLAIPFDKWEFVLNQVQRVLTRGGRLEIIDDQFIYPYANPNRITPHATSPSISSHIDEHLPSTPLYLDAPAVLSSGRSGFDVDGDDDVNAGSDVELEPHHEARTLPVVADVAADQNGSRRPRSSSLLLGPRPNVRPLSLPADAWRRRLGVDDNEAVVPITPPSSDDSEDENEPQTNSNSSSSPSDSSSSDDEDYGQEVEVKLPFEGVPVPSPNVSGPRPNARPMNMDGVRWKNRLSFSLWQASATGDSSSSSEELSPSKDLTSAKSETSNRISTGSTTSSSDSSCSTYSSAGTASTAATSVEAEDEPKVSVEAPRRPPAPVRPLPLTPPSLEDLTDVPPTPTVVIDDCDFVASPEEENEEFDELDSDPDDLFSDLLDHNNIRPPTPMTAATVRPSYKRNSTDERAAWQAHATHSQELETVFTDMLRNKYGVGPEPSLFLESAMQRIFGEGKAGRVRSMHLMLAPEEFNEYVEDDEEVDHSHSKKEKKKGSVRWGDDHDKDGEKEKEKDKQRMRVLSMDWDKKEKEKQLQRTRALTEPMSSRNSNDSTGSLTLPPGMSAKAATKLGITYSALASATAESRASVIFSSSTSPAEEQKKPKQSPGLLLWPSTLIPVPPAELEMHACKNMHDLLGCKPALAEWVSGYVDENGERVVSDDEFKETMWEYECFRRKRLNLPESLPETDMDANETFSTPLTPARNIEIPTTPRQSSKSPSHAKTMSNSSISSTGTATRQELAGGMFAKEDLTHLRTIRVYEAVKSWRPRPLSQQSEDNSKTPTSASPI